MKQLNFTILLIFILLLVIFSFNFLKPGLTGKVVAPTGKTQIEQANFNSTDDSKIMALEVIDESNDNQKNNSNISGLKKKDNSQIENAKGSVSYDNSDSNIRGKSRNEFQEQPGTIVEDIIVISPSKDKISTGNLNITFSLIGKADSCALIINGEESKSLTSFAVLNHFDISLSPGIYYWNIECDFIDSYIMTKTRKIMVISDSAYDGIEDYENAKDFKIKENSGSIFFLDGINLSRAMIFEKYVLIKKNLISIDSKNLPELNKPAILTFSNLSFENPIILRDGNFCSDCEILENSGNLTFLVQHFSAYSSTENSRLFIFDSSDSQTKYSNQLVTFHANFSNYTGVSISGSCIINFTDSGSNAMIYNPVSKYYEYNRSFSSSGVFFYEIGCIGAGYTSIGLMDYASINTRMHPYGANITSYGSERGNSSVLSNMSLEAGNLTALNLYSLSLSNYWQGFYGNITGRISLGNSQGYTFYDWNVLELDGEVFASRAFDVNFATLNCSNHTHMASEEYFLGQSAGSAESVSKTFKIKQHPSFAVGLSPFLQNQCNSTALYTNGMQGTAFYEVLLTDDASNIVYTAIITEDAVGFDGSSYDFQMIVGDIGGEQVTAYYFFLELE